jgi:GDP-4-dehydro-6-deoxy-D-mannose reductase
MIGKHLAQVLSENGVEVAGLSRATSASRYLKGDSKFHHYAGDILDRNFLEQTWKHFKPDLVYHLAAQAYNGDSWAAEDTTYALNVQGARKVFEVCRTLSPSARLIPACSSAEYGFVPEHLIPIREDVTPLRPITPYGVSKACMEMMARQFCLNYKMDVVLPRLFIHVGPDHPPATALQSFAMQLARIKLGQQPPRLQVGNLDSSRDFVDVRDGVRALWLLAQKGKTGEVYQVCTGKAWNMRQSLEMLIAISQLKVEVVHDPSRLRLSDEQVLLGAPDKLKALGWTPEIPFEQTLRDIFENWVTRLSA